MTRYLAAVAAGDRLTGRHVFVFAHPDDEAISCAAALCCTPDALLVYLTTGTYGEERLARLAERRAALHAAGWHAQVLDAGELDARQAYRHVRPLLAVVSAALAGAEAVWTHPYEGGHLDHDTAAWLVQTACARAPWPAPTRLEFASYHATDPAKGQSFGTFWPDPDRPATTVRLDPARWQRKRAACAAYASQTRILAKFLHPEREEYRGAPHYDFADPAPPPRARWDAKKHQPPTAEWRRAVAEARA